MSATEIFVPDIGADEAEVIELSVRPGDTVKAEDTLMVLESAKATMEIPSPTAGAIREFKVAVGDKVKRGDLIGVMQVADGAAAPVVEKAAPAPAVPAPSVAPDLPTPPSVPSVAPVVEAGAPAPAERATVGKAVHAGPAVRKLAREFGVDLSLVPGSGPRQRILKEDVQAFVKGRLKQAVAVGGVSAGAGIPAVRLPDFSQFGPVSRSPMSRLHVLTAENMQRSWLNVPHVTQFEDADITDLETFREGQKAAAEKRGTKLTVMPFLLKACAYALRTYPQFNVSIDYETQEVIHKNFVHLGVAVDTPAGLVVPVLRDVDRKGLWELSDELTLMAGKARDKKLTPADMQGGCFTISSLGGVGGTAFTPIVNTPEVAILGVSRSAMKPAWNGQAFVPRLMLPLSLSYDHRAINGADAARFTSLLAKLLGDVRHLLL